jgi:dTDP-4-dehydrorhamnose reductase
MRLLITGASGLLGLNLALEAAGLHDVIGVSRRALASTPFESRQADLLEAGAIGRILEAVRPAAVVHCAAAADVDFCERHPEIARRINAEVPGQMASDCSLRNIRLIHISTDAVFDGLKDGSYSETDKPQPGSIYAITKYAGEQAALQANPYAIVARVNFYGWSLSGGRSLGEFFVKNLRRGAAVRGFTDVRFCPTFVNDLAQALMRLLESELRGTYHVVGSEAMTKYEFGVAIARQFGYDESLISPESVEEFGLAARRSHNLGLLTDKLSTDLGISLPDFSTGLDRFHRQFLQGFPQQIQSYQQATAAAVGGTGQSETGLPPEGS